MKNEQGERDVQEKKQSMFKKKTSEVGDERKSLSSQRRKAAAVKSKTEEQKRSKSKTKTRKAWKVSGQTQPTHKPYNAYNEFESIGILPSQDLLKHMLLSSAPLIDLT